MVVVAAEPVRPEDEDLLERILVVRPPRRSRVVPLGLFVLNLDQHAMALAIAGGPEGLFPEPKILAEGLNETFGRFVPRFPA